MGVAAPDLGLGAEPCELEPLLLPSLPLLPDFPLPLPDDSDSDSDCEWLGADSVVVDSSEVGRDDVDESWEGSVESDAPVVRLDEASALTGGSCERSVGATARSPPSSLADSSSVSEALGFVTGEAKPSTASSAHWMP